MESGSDERLSRASRLLREAEGRVRILRTLSWPLEVEARFFATGGKELPIVAYEPADPTPTLERVEAATRLLDAGDPDHAMLFRHAEAIAHGARMLGAVGTPQFTEHARRIYGTPNEPILDGETTPLALARSLADALGRLRAFPTTTKPARLDPEELAERMRVVVAARLGDEAPTIEVATGLASKAVAGPRKVRIADDAELTDDDVAQLLHHEVFVHVITGLNGRVQEALPLLAAGHPGTTRTQEGLAVFSEVVGRAMTPERLARLADRVLAVALAFDGADFVELYRFFLERGGEPRQSFDDARRVVRGGLVSGGAPFPKDATYLEGLVRVRCLVQAALSHGSLEPVRMLFVGKVDTEDVPTLLRLGRRGLVRAPLHLPPWLDDARSLVSWLSVEGLLQQGLGQRIRARYGQAFADALGA